MEPQKFNVVKDYKTHQSHAVFLKSELHCPNCGEQRVFIEDGMGDYYEGEDHLCIGCKCYFTMPSLQDANGVHLQMIEQITAQEKPAA